jgi:hypothetical protein
MFKELEKKNPNPLCHPQYKKYKLASGQNSKKHPDFLRRAACAL